MNRTKFLWLGMLFAFLFVATSCEKEETTSINESEVLAQYLESAESPLMKDYVSTDLPAIISATDLNNLNLTDKVYIIDIRSATDFATGHIENAVNVAFADILSHIKGVDLTNYDKVAVVCYTGQTAGYATSILRFMGYGKVYSLKWGMCSWNEAFAGKWNTAIGNGNAYGAQMVTDETAKGEKGGMPTLTTGKTTGQGILEVRIDSLLAQGFTPATVTNSTVFGSLSNYYIVNYWSPAHYAVGHIPGSIQYTPKESLKFAADLTTLPNDKTIAVYCYTGQTSAALVVYLRLLGYDAKSILYGTNGMMYDKMGEYNGTNPEAKMTMFKASEIMGYEYVTN